MSNQRCGCSESTCDCCGGVSVLTPQSEYNRPGLAALTCRAGTHGSFLETMKARIAGFTLQAVEADGQTVATFRPLEGLTTRDASDPAIALLDGWATVADVLTFYQERIANEGYLRTATERRSVLELARLVGYTLRPGVSATVYVAYTLDDNQTDPVVIPAGSRSQSVPGPGELPQYFETTDDLATRKEWNNLQVRLTIPQNITLANALQVSSLYVGEVSTSLRTGDLLLLSFGDGELNTVARRVLAVDSQFLNSRTAISLQPAAPGVAAAAPLLAQFITAALALQTSVIASTAEFHPAEYNPDGVAIDAASRILNDTYLDNGSAPDGWVKVILEAPDGYVSAPLQTLLTDLQSAIDAALKNPPPAPGDAVTDPSLFVPGLLKPANPQPANTALLQRSLQFQLSEQSDAHPQLLVTFAPTLDDTLYKAWANANVASSAPALKAVYAARVAAPLFGSTVSRVPDSTKPVSGWSEWTLDPTEFPQTLFLDRPYQSLLAGSLVMVQKPYGTTSVTRNVYTVTAAQTTPRTAYGISGNSTRLDLDRSWWYGGNDSMSTLRGAYVYGQTEPLTLVEAPMPDTVSGSTVELGGLYKELTSGRWVILSGERADLPGVSGVFSSELLMLSNLIHGTDPGVPGDKVHTTLQLATPTAYTYKRSTLTVYGNVAKANNGQTRNEVLGSGDATQTFAAFTLRQPPLTYVSDPNPTGVVSTLAVSVDNVQWRQVDTLAGLGPKDRVYTTSTDDNANTTVVFGNGESGAVPSTGVQNLTAVYRSDLGPAGNVRAGQISMLVSQPLGVKSVLNPLPASGGAGPESRDQARGNAPLAVMSLDRLVSVVDYANFTRTYAGIGKASASRISNGRRQLIHVTIAGADDATIDPTSDLYRNLLPALRAYGDPSLPVQVDARELLILVLSAKVQILSTYKWAVVSAAIRAALLAQFGFDARDLGQPALLCEIIAAIQNIEGVVYVDIVSFGGIPEKKAAADGTRALLTLDELARSALVVARAEKIPRAVTANLAGFEKGGIRPAQLAILTPNVPDTLILNQVVQP